MQRYILSNTLADAQNTYLSDMEIINNLLGMEIYPHIMHYSYQKVLKIAKLTLNEPLLPSRTIRKSHTANLEQI